MNQITQQYLSDGVPVSKLQNIIRTIGVDEFWHDDVMVEMVLVFYNHPKCSEAWKLKVARNKAIDFVRKVNKGVYSNIVRFDESIHG